MKKSRLTHQSRAQEQCGVWLDTVQLKKEKKNKHLAKPISKLLNPFVKGGGYNVAVALNFTQTKMEMPKTKQSSISSFFTRQNKVFSDHPSPEVSESGLMMSSLPATSAPVASKRKRGFQLEECEAECCLNLDWKREIVSDSEASVLQELSETNILPFQNSALPCRSEEMHSEESNLPQSKKQFVKTSTFLDASHVSSDATGQEMYSTQSETDFTDTSTYPGDSQPLPQAWSQDPLFTFSQYIDSEFTQDGQETNPLESTLFDSLSGENTFVLQVKGAKKTSTQNPLTSSSYLEEEKENSRCLSSQYLSFSQNQCLPRQEIHKTKTASPGKLTRNPLEECVVPSSLSLFRQKTLSSSPLKTQGQRQQGRCEDANSLSTLFTQDSEGFRVISHRQLQPRSPLRESNVSTKAVRKCVRSTLLTEEEEDEMLFTQDSQGNMVIKH